MGAAPTPSRTPTGLFLAVLLLLLPPGCAVKPALRYVSPDGTLHQAHGSPTRRAPEPMPGAVASEPTKDPSPSAPDIEPADDPVQAHFTSAVGLHLGCRYGEALATYRGVVEAEPDGPYAGRCLVRMAEIYLEPGYHARDPERARALLREVLARFPDSAAAAAAQELLDGS